MLRVIFYQVDPDPVFSRVRWIRIRLQNRICNPGKKKAGDDSRGCVSPSITDILPLKS